MNLVEIKHKTGTSVWKSFFNGMFSALGYVTGLAIVIVVLGWFLNKTGLLPAFKTEMQNFSDVINQAKNLTAPSNNKGTSTTVTLPNGQKVQVEIPK